MPELKSSAIVDVQLHVTHMNGHYDIILGRDILSKLGIILDFQQQIVCWEDEIVHMRPTTCTQETTYNVNDTPDITAETDRMSKILDAKYSPADLDEVAKKNENLTLDQKSKLHELLKKHESLFDGTLGKWVGEPYKVELKEGVKPYHAHPYQVPQAYERTFRMEVERLCKVGVLKKVNRSEWAAPTFIIPKKDNTVRFISDFRELNQRIRRKPYPIPKIQDLLLKLEGFQYATSLDLNMGYYHIELVPHSK